ncbi:glycosyltransferase family 4 protein [Tistlia consotensis]|uniref:glycosyltransferase family 4 protein n=1 Tax=Tistlia consotensis TaxID=1321365 RepID=UPI0013562928|nr:glycosyltransferase family 1 protein [Tistlia consotensis]
MGVEPATVLLCPVLPSDGWVSLELYYEDVRRALQAARLSAEVQTVLPSQKTAPSRLGKQIERYLDYPSLVRRAYRAATKPAVVHVLDQSYGHLCRSDLPTVVTCHDLALFEIHELNPLQLALWKYRVRGMRRARRVVAVSEATARDVERQLGMARARISVSHEGVDPKFRPRNIEGRKGVHLARLAGRRGDGLLLHVGSNLRRKGIDTLLAALAVLVQEGLDVRLAKVGRDPSQDGYGGLIEELGLRDRILYLGRLDDDALVDVYNACDVFCFPSRFEGFGRPVLEAMACGLPVVAAQSSSLPEVGGSAALFHPPGDVAALAAQVRRILTEAGLAERMRGDGFANCRRFSWRQHGADLIAAYRAALAERSGG